MLAPPILFLPSYFRYQKLDLVLMEREAFCGEMPLLVGRINWGESWIYIFHKIWQFEGDRWISQLRCHGYNYCIAQNVILFIDVWNPNEKKTHFIALFDSLLITILIDLRERKNYRCHWINPFRRYRCFLVQVVHINDLFMFLSNSTRHQNFFGNHFIHFASTQW